MDHERVVWEAADDQLEQVAGSVSPSQQVARRGRHPAGPSRSRARRRGRCRRRRSRGVEPTRGCPHAISVGRKTPQRHPLVEARGHLGKAARSVRSLWRKRRTWVIALASVLTLTTGGLLVTNLANGHPTSGNPTELGSSDNLASLSVSPATVSLKVDQSQALVIHGQRSGGPPNGVRPSRPTLSQRRDETHLT